MSTEYTISISKANLIAMIMIVPIGIILATPMCILYGLEVFSLKNLSLGTAFSGSMKFALLVLLGIPVHEALHGFGWAIFAKHGFKSISFGIKWEYLTPYCHCNEPLKRFPFLIGAILPLVVLGLFPAVYAYFTGNFTIWFFGFFFTIAAGGDIIAIWMLRKVKKGQLVQDHPSELGFIILDEPV